MSQSAKADNQPVTTTQQVSQEVNNSKTVSSAIATSPAVSSTQQEQNVNTVTQQVTASTSDAPKGQFGPGSVPGKRSYYNNDGQKVVGNGNTASTLAYRNVNGKTYAFDNNGDAYTGFLNGWNNTYYFGNDGARYTNQWYYNWGNYYYFGSDGALLTNNFLNSKQLPTNDGKGGVTSTNQNHVYYFNPKTGTMARNQFYNNWGHTYYFGSNGARYTDRFYNNWGNTYYFGSDGARYTNSFYNNWGNTYYFGNDGARYTNRWYSNWGHRYFFGNGGVRATNTYFNALGIGGDYDAHWADNSGVVSDVHYFSQYTPVFAPWGCAGASLAMLLSIRNVYPNLYDLIHNEPNVYGSRNQGWAGGQSGNVVTGAGFDRVIQPNALSAYGRKFFSGVRDISYTNLSNIARVVQSGHPVLYYGWSAYDAGGNRNHCKIILGYNARNNSFHVYDPLYGYRGRWTAHSTGGNAYDLGYNAWVPAWHIQGEMSGQALSIY